MQVEILVPTENPCFPFDPLKLMDVRLEGVYTFKALRTEGTHGSCLAVRVFGAFAAVFSLEFAQCSHIQKSPWRVLA